MDSSRKVKISDIPRVSAIELSDLFVISRDVDQVSPYDKSFSIQMSDILRSIRKDFRYWTSYEYNTQEKSLNMYDEPEIFAVTLTDEYVQMLTMQTNSGITSFELIQTEDELGEIITELKILP